MTKKVELDTIDRQILNILLKDANTAYVDIAKRIHVSPGTIHVRMKRLKELDLIKNAFMNVDFSKLGYDICAFLGVHLDKGSMYLQVIEELQKIPEVVSAHHTTGIYAIFVKIICRNTEHLRAILYDKIQDIPGIQRTETFLSMEESINRSISITEEDEEEH